MLAGNHRALFTDRSTIGDAAGPVRSADSTVRSRD